jgi:hypothetical protein
MLSDNVFLLEDVTHLWRVFNPKYLRNDIRNRHLTLVRPNSWDDPFENFLEKCRFKLPTGEAVNAGPILNRVFGQCWTTAEAETDATWRIYSPNKLGVRIRCSILKLVGSMWDVRDHHAAIKYFAGRVTYVPVEVINVSLRSLATAILTGNGGRSLVQSLLIKRREFEHEQEARLIFYDADDQFAQDRLWSFAVEPTEVFDEAVFDPRMTEAEVTEWTVELRAAGFTGSIAQSTLYRPPSWEVTLT